MAKYTSLMEPMEPTSLKPLFVENSELRPRDDRFLLGHAWDFSQAVVAWPQVESFHRSGNPTANHWVYHWWSIKVFVLPKQLASTKFKLHHQSLFLMATAKTKKFVGLWSDTSPPASDPVAAKTWRFLSVIVVELNGNWNRHTVYMLD